ncbi:MAG: dockerin type I repeat-containing protein, partial [Eubacterium sp.]|nr:dockerin type I repeat-containing protein [Eubacterium sp.]
GEDGSDLKTQTVEHGKAASAPNAPGIDGKTFKEWDKDYSSVTDDLTVTAVYKDKVYTVTFVGKYGYTEKQEVEYGKTADEPNVNEYPWNLESDFTFIGWDKDFSNVTSDLFVMAKYKDNALQAILDAIKELMAQQEAAMEEADHALNDIESVIDKINDSFDKIIEDLEEIEQGINDIKQMFEENISHSQFEGNIKTAGGVINANYIDGEVVTFNFVETQEKEEIDDSVYNTQTAVWADISLTVNEVEYEGQLKTPMVITTPTPTGIKDDFLVLHYGDDGEVIETITPTDNGDGTFSFIVHSFSTYAFVNLILLGDCDSNSEVNATDLTYMKQFLLGKETRTPAMDCNGDGKVDVADLTYLKRYLVKK